MTWSQNIAWFRILRITGHAFRACDLKRFFYGYDIYRRLGRVDVLSGGWGWGSSSSRKLPLTRNTFSIFLPQIPLFRSATSELPPTRLNPSNLTSAQGQRHDFNQLNPFQSFKSFQSFFVRYEYFPQPYRNYWLLLDMPPLTVLGKNSCWPINLNRRWSFENAPLQLQLPSILFLRTSTLHFTLTRV